MKKRLATKKLVPLSPLQGQRQFGALDNGSGIKFAPPFTGGQAALMLIGRSGCRPSFAFSIRFFPFWSSSKVVFVYRPPSVGKGFSGSATGAWKSGILDSFSSLAPSVKKWSLPAFVPRLRPILRPFAVCMS